MAKAFGELKIAVLLGGSSAEREISLVTGKAVVTALQQSGHLPLVIDLGPATPQRLLDEKVDFVFNALHGTLGEDGKVQGMLDVLGIPYSGSGVLASALGMNKITAKCMFSQAQLITADFLLWERGEELPDVEGRLGYPLVVKPANQGSAIGVSIVRTKEALRASLDEAGKFGEVLLEKYLSGTELSVGVLDEMALPVIEIIPQGEFYDYAAKYQPGGSEHIIPARISEAETKRAQETALKAHKALLCEGYSRVDMIRHEGRMYILEVNTLPGMTSTSLLPQAASKAGISFEELVKRIVELGMKKNKRFN